MLLASISLRLDLRKEAGRREVRHTRKKKPMVVKTQCLWKT